MRQMIYKAALALIPPPIDRLRGAGLGQEAERDLLKIIRHHHCLGGVLRLFDIGGHLAAYHFGMAGEGRQVTDDTAFRIASISKMITAICVLKLAQEGMVSLDEDTGLLPRPVTLRELMSHTAGILDGPAYVRALKGGTPLNEVLSQSLDESLAGQWAYSNLGAGAAASVLEEKLGISFETIMQRHLFEPLGVRASFYPQRVKGELADARRVFPPEKHPGFDARARRILPSEGIDRPDPQHHYSLAQGNCCLGAGELQKLVKVLMRPGFLSQASLDTMRSPLTSFGRKKQRLKQGLGLFGLWDDPVYPGQLYGHQGKAYGAVHAAFFEPKTGRGMIFLSTGISEARAGFLADAVCDLLRFSFREDIPA